MGAQHTHRPYHTRPWTKREGEQMEFEFFMAMIPPTITAQEHKIVIRNGKPFYYDPPELMAARQKLTNHLASHRPLTGCVSGPIELTTTWCFHTEDSRLDGTLKTTKPDTDNLNKLLKDCMTQLGFWNDDAQVCREIIEKYWVKTSPSGIFVRIRQL